MMEGKKKFSGLRVYGPSFVLRKKSKLDTDCPSDRTIRFLGVADHEP